MSVLNILSASAGAVAAAFGLIHVKVKTSAVLVHHDTHRKGLTVPDAQRHLVELLSILALSTPFEEYDRVHTLHHARDSFATLDDEEAAFLHGLGFRPGTPRRQSWRLLWRALLSPRLHVQQIVQRLRLNFLHGPLQRRRLAWLIWPTLLAGAALTGLLPAMLLGVMLPLLVGGNIGSLLELVSRHRWLVTPESPPKNAVERQFMLSHGRFLAPLPPLSTAGVRAWTGWGLRVVAASLARLMVVPADLAWHIAHHTGQRGAEGAPAPAWVDAASAFSKAYWEDARLQAQSHGSILGAIDAWFIALEAEGQR